MALIPSTFLDTTVALGAAAEDGTVQYTATGFLYEHQLQPTAEGEAPRAFVFLVTNRHVADRGRELHVRFNVLADGAQDVRHLPPEGDEVTRPWITHPDPEIDVAVRLLNAPGLGAAGTALTAYDSQRHVFLREEARATGMSEGDGVFVLGFPMGLAGEERNYVIVRQGIIARIRNWLDGRENSFLIDASIFPGNSGGPVLIKPEATAIQGTRPNGRCGLIGMVSSYLPYQEVAVSKQTGRPRMIFEENSGLGVVVPVDEIAATVAHALEAHNAR